MNHKLKSFLLWAAAGLLALAFFGAGVTKLLGVQMQLDNLKSWGYPAWFRFPIGLSEIGLALLLLLPRTRRLAAFLVYPWALVAIATHVQAGQYNQLGAAILFAVLASVVRWLDRSSPKTLAV
ncbi:hypothetical protein GCM10023185_15320 [Hymenobacter saemangeumensis]|uniref:DoxX family protein n=1 Tax=Hymenobacter saemangeumensis TaxID=1084522 RepID=A0ABP8I969_9BACT